MSVRPDPPEVQPFPEGIDVLVLPGFPDREIRLDEPGSPYPSTTVDVVKRLRQLGLGVDYAEPREVRLEVTLKAFELWIPVLQVTQQVFINLGVWQLIKAFELRSAARESEQTSVSDNNDDASDKATETADSPLLHVRLAVVREGARETRWIEADGSPEAVARMLSRLQDELRE
jgi:hypothetical protein